MTSIDPTTSASPAIRRRAPTWYLWTFALGTLAAFGLAGACMATGHRVLGTLVALAVGIAWIADFAWSLKLIAAAFANGVFDAEESRKAAQGTFVVLVGMAVVVAVIIGLGWSIGAPPPVALR